MPCACSVGDSSGIDALADCKNCSVFLLAYEPDDYIVMSIRKKVHMYCFLLKSANKLTCAVEIGDTVYRVFKPTLARLC